MYRLGNNDSTVTEPNDKLELTTTKKMEIITSINREKRSDNDNEPVDKTFDDFLDDEFANYEDESFDRLLDGFLMDDYLYSELKNYFEMYDIKSKDDLEMFGVDEVDYSQSEESEDEQEKIDKVRWLHSSVDKVNLDDYMLITLIIIFIFCKVYITIYPEAPF